MDLTPHSGIIVDSSFSSRKKLTEDLRESRLVQNIYEAKSVADALQHLSSENADICFIGPTVSIATALTFASSVKTVQRTEPCALIAVVSSRKEEEAEMLRGKMNGVLHQPYDKKTFTSITLKAVRSAHLEKISALRQVESAYKAIENLSSELLKYAIAAAKADRETENLAFQQRLYSDIRTSLSKSLELSGLKEFSEEDTQFTRTVTEWFFESAKLGRKQATENLRLKLLGGLNQAK